MSFAVNLIAAKHAKNMQRFPPDKEAEFHQKGELKSAAIFTLVRDLDYYPHNWDDWYLKRVHDEDDEIEHLVNASALLCADIERIAKERGLITTLPQNDPWKIIEVPGKGSVLFFKDKDVNGFCITIKSEIPHISPGMMRHFGHQEDAMNLEFSIIDVVYATNMVEEWEALLKSTK